MVLQPCPLLAQAVSHLANTIVGILKKVASCMLLTYRLEICKCNLGFQAANLIHALCSETGRKEHENQR